MIAQRHLWLLRNEDTCFEGVDAPAGSNLYGCKACAVTGVVVRLPLRDHKRHLADHRREKIDRSEDRDEYLEPVA